MKSPLKPWNDNYFYLEDGLVLLTGVLWWWRNFYRITEFYSRDWERTSSWKYVGTEKFEDKPEDNASIDYRNVTELNSHEVKVISGDANRNRKADNWQLGGWQGYVEASYESSLEVGERKTVEIPLEYNPFDIVLESENGLVSASTSTETESLGVAVGDKHLDHYELYKILDEDSSKYENVNGWRIDSKDVTKWYACWYTGINQLSLGVFETMSDARIAYNSISPSAIVVDSTIENIPRYDKDYKAEWTVRGYDYSYDYVIYYQGGQSSGTETFEEWKGDSFGRSGTGWTASYTFNKKIRDSSEDVTMTKWFETRSEAESRGSLVDTRTERVDTDYEAKYKEADEEYTDVFDTEEGASSHVGDYGYSYDFTETEYHVMRAVYETPMKSRDRHYDVITGWDSERVEVRIRGKNGFSGEVSPSVKSESVDVDYPASVTVGSITSFDMSMTPDWGGRHNVIFEASPRNPPEPGFLKVADYELNANAELDSWETETLLDPLVSKAPVPENYELILVVNGPGSVDTPKGTVTDFDSQIYERRTEVSLKAVPEEGADFEKWTDCGSEVVSFENEITIKMNSDVKREAFFKESLQENLTDFRVEVDPEVVTFDPTIPSEYQTEVTVRIIGENGFDEPVYVEPANSMVGLPIDVSSGEIKEKFVEVSLHGTEMDPVTELSWKVYPATYEAFSKTAQISYVYGNSAHILEWPYRFIYETETL